MNKNIFLIITAAFVFNQYAQLACSYSAQHTKQPLAAPLCKQINNWVANRELPQLRQEQQREALKVMIVLALFSCPKLAPHIGFKGSGPSLLFYGLNRFTTDLDFDLLDERQKNYVANAMEQILKQYGTVKTKRKSLLTRFKLFYQDKQRGPQEIKIDLNLRKPFSTYETKSFLGVPVQAMTQQDIAANKLVSMHERLGRINKDIYDTHFILKHAWPINKKLVEQRTGMNYTAFLQQCIADISSLPDNHIADGLEDVLNKQQLAWAATHLKPETIKLLRSALKHNL